MPVMVTIIKMELIEAGLGLGVRLAKIAIKISNSVQYSLRITESIHLQFWLGFEVAGYN